LEILEARFVVVDEGLDVFVEVVIPCLETLRGEGGPSMNAARERLCDDGPGIGTLKFEVVGQCCQKLLE
jgi:hypothetical protein